MINFSGASVLAYSHKSFFFGNAFEYKTTKDLTIRGILTHFDKYSGVKATWADMSGILAASTDYDDVILNGENFGQGKITNIRFDAGTQVRVTPWTVDLSIIQTGNLFNFTGALYTGISTTGFHYIDELEENFSYNLNESNNSSYIHSVKLRLNSGIGISPIPMAKVIAAELFSSNGLSGFLGSGYVNQKKYYKETYNVINSECSWEERREFNLVSGNYSLVYTHSLQTDNDGITNISENGVIQGLVVPLSGSAYTGWNTEKGNIFARSADVFSGYTEGIYPINPAFVSLGCNFNSFEGKVDYSAVLTNNPRFSTGYTWEYENRINQDENGIYTVSEQGQVIGIGKRGQAKYDKAVIGYDFASTGIGVRISGIYSQYVGGSFVLHKVNSSQSRSFFQGQIDYNQTYTDGTNISGVNGIRQTDISVNDENAVPLANRFNIVNAKEVIQPAGIATLGKRSLDLSLVGPRTFSIGDYLAQAKTVAALYVPTDGTEVYLNGCSYEYNTGKNAFSLRANWIFHQSGVGFDDITL